MRQCGFKLESGSGSGRMFRHETTGQRVRLHEPHPRNILLDYMVKELIEALKNAGDIGQ
jgi:predicted RNA binding protein YcfA (HicA-like mRNA interferase family)